MGLDVHLVRYHVDPEVVERYDHISESVWNGVGKEYDAMSEAEKEATRAAVKVAEADFLRENNVPSFRAGSAAYSWDTHGYEVLETPSALWPEHYFKRGYFRSSYNSGGINSVLKAHGFDDLYSLFTPGDEYVIRPNWERVVLRAKILRDQFRAHVAGLDGIQVMRESSALVGPMISSEHQALEVWRQHVRDKPEKYNEGEVRSYWSGGGLYFMGPEPLKVRAIMVGEHKFIGRAEPAVYLIYEGDGLDWYAQALDIVVETCEWVIAQPDREQLALHWSS